MLGHSINIIIALCIFLLSHYILDHPTVLSIIITLIGTIVGAVISSVVGTKRLTVPVHTLSQELHRLHEKINASANALTKLSTESHAFSEALPIGIITLNAKDELTHINAKALQQLSFPNTPEGEEAEEVLKTEDIFSRIIEIESHQSNTTSITDWLHEAKTKKIQDSHVWPLIASEDTEGKPIAYDMLVRYNKEDTFGYEVVILLIDRSQEYTRQEKQMEFISLAAHELRGPIAVLRGLVDIFREELEPDMSTDHKELLHRMRVSTRQLAGYVDNILNVSHIEKDDFTVRLSEAAWQDVLQQALSELSIRANAHYRIIETHIPKDIPHVAVDVTAILHVINNLVDNAIKYSRVDGVIKIKVEQKEDVVETTVQDFGVGIPANVIDNLFTKFYRSHISRGAVNGTGLGLYLCKAIITAHGGNIWVRSSEGKGTTFGFTLPTYVSVAENLKNNNNEGSGIIRGSHGWIKNHALYRR